MSGFRIGRHKYGLGSFLFLNFASLVNMDVCQKTKLRKSVNCDEYNRMENQTYKAISNFDKGAKINSMLNMASRSTVSLKPFASTRCFLVCQQNLGFQLYYGSTTDV